MRPDLLLSADISDVDDEGRVNLQENLFYHNGNLEESGMINSSVLHDFPTFMYYLSRILAVLRVL